MGLGHRDGAGNNGATPDEELVEQAQRGHCEAFGVLWDRYHRRIYGFCYRRLGYREAAEDATGETFRKALTALSAYQVRAFRSWLFAIAHNVVVDELRTRRPHLPLEAAAGLRDPIADPEEAAVRAADFKTTTALLRQLSYQQRDVIALRLAGLRPAEIASVLGVSRAAVDMAHMRAVIRLRDLMAVGQAHEDGGGHRD